MHGNSPIFTICSNWYNICQLKESIKFEKTMNKMVNIKIRDKFDGF